MRLIEKMSLDEICEKLGKNMNYVKTTQKRGIRNLKFLISAAQNHVH
jgi:DNA-directed RNA polymerase specialized sigma24 family protein